MKLAAAAASFLRSSAAAMLVLLPLLLIGWAEEAAALPFHRVLSPALRSEETYQNVEKVAREVGCDFKKSYFSPRLSDTLEILMLFLRK